MSRLETLPPTRHHPSLSRAISPSAAAQLLDNYLSLSEDHPELHPDAIITPQDVIFAAHGGPQGSNVMHNLRRVAAGLRGEFLEPEKTPEPEEQEEEQGGKYKKKGKRRDVETIEDNKGAPDVGATEEGWVEMSEYEREEGRVEVGEVGTRDHFVEGGGEEPEIEAEGEEGSKKRKMEKLDKEARKKAKKERNKELRREKERKKAEKKDAE